jgi:hypothetical protein
LYHFSFETNDAPLRGCNGYTGSEKIASFKDWIKRLLIENAKLPEENQFAELCAESKYIAKINETKKTASDATASNRLAEDAMKAVYPIIEDNLGTLPPPASLGTAATPLDIDSSETVSVIHKASSSMRDKKRLKAAQTMNGNGNILNGAPAFLDHINGTFAKLGAILEAKAAPVSSTGSDALAVLEKKIDRMEKGLAQAEKAEPSDEVDKMKLELKNALNKARLEYTRMSMSM